MIYCTECGLPLMIWKMERFVYRVQCSGCHAVYEAQVKLLRGSDRTPEELAVRMNRNR
jgi:hypothetical protein